MNPTQIHKWEPTGVTGYPITHPIVGQTDFYRKLKHWLPLVSGDRFAHVFALVAPWGVGKSRLGYEVVAQVNDASRGWKVREDDGALTDARLFDSDAQREKYLALYIRYSQVAHRRLNLDNWFAPAVYKALVPLAKATFDTSIQHRIAKQALDRLEAEGFDPTTPRGSDGNRRRPRRPDLHRNGACHAALQRGVHGPGRVRHRLRHRCAGRVGDGRGAGDRRNGGRRGTGDGRQVHHHAAQGSGVAGPQGHRDDEQGGQGGGRSRAFPLAAVRRVVLAGHRRRVEGGPIHRPTLRDRRPIPQRLLRRQHLRAQHRGPRGAFSVRTPPGWSRPPT